MFSKLLRRNLMAMLVPIFIIEATLFFMVNQLGLLENYSCHEISTLDGLDVMYDAGVKNISYKCEDELFPAGFDEVAEGERLGTYYYLFEGDTIRLFILKDKTYESLKSDGTATIYGRLEKDENKSKYVEQSYAEQTGKGADVFNGAVQPVIINEIEYPFRRINIIKVAKLAVPGLIVVTIIYMIVALIWPQFTFGINMKGFKRSRKKMIKILNKEMRDMMEEQEGNVYATKHFVIEAYVSHIDISKNK